MKTIKILCSLLCTMLLATLPASAQNTDDKNKAIIETNEGSQELNTDEISVIRFDGGKITIVHAAHPHIPASQSRHAAPDSHHQHQPQNWQPRPGD